MTQKKDKSFASTPARGKSKKKKFSDGRGSLGDFSCRHLTLSQQQNSDIQHNLKEFKCGGSE